MEWHEALTKKKREELLIATTQALKELVGCPVVGDLVEEVQLASKDCGFLYLTSKGLMEKVSERDSFAEKTTYKPRTVSEGNFRDIVIKYELSRVELENLRQRLLSEHYDSL